MDTLYIDAAFLVSNHLDYEVNLIDPPVQTMAGKHIKKLGLMPITFISIGKPSKRPVQSDTDIMGAENAEEPEKGATQRRSDPSYGYIRRFTHDKIANCIGDNSREVLETLAHLDNNTPQCWIYAW